MAYKLKTREKLPHAIRRIAKGQVDRITKELAEHRPDHWGHSIHEARMDLKKVRAALRLVRDQLGGRIYKRDDRSFRLVAQALAQPRDAEALIKAVEKLRKIRSGPTARTALAKLRKISLQRRNELLSGLNGGSRKVMSDLRSARCHVKKWPVDRLKWSDLCRGLRRTYQLGLEAFQKAGQMRQSDCLHEWRKRVKDLWYQLRILEPIQPKAISGLTEELKQLSDYLGDDHDLVMIEEAAKKAGLERRESQALARLIQYRHNQLQLQAFDLGHKLYQEKPASFARRIARRGKKSRDY